MYPIMILIRAVDWLGKLPRLFNASFLTRRPPNCVRFEEFSLVIRDAIEILVSLNEYTRNQGNMQFVQLFVKETT